MTGPDTPDLSPEDQSTVDGAVRDALTGLGMAFPTELELPESPDALMFAKAEVRYDLGGQLLPLSDELDLLTEEDRFERLLERKGLGFKYPPREDETSLDPNNIRNLADTQLGFVDGTSPERIWELTEDFDPNSDPEA